MGDGRDDVIAGEHWILRFILDPPRWFQESLVQCLHDYTIQCRFKIQFLAIQGPGAGGSFASFFRSLTQEPARVTCEQWSITSYLRPGGPPLH